MRTLMALIGCFAIMSFSAVGADSTKPGMVDVDAVSAFHSWLDAFNSSDGATYARFILTRFPSGERDSNSHRRFLATTGGFDLRMVEPAPGPRGRTGAGSHP